MKIKFVEGENKSLENFVDKIHGQYEKENNARCHYKKFSFYIEKDGEIAGVIIGYTCWNGIEIDNLCVDEKHRRQGYG